MSESSRQIRTAIRFAQTMIKSLVEAGRAVGISMCHVLGMEKIRVDDLAKDVVLLAMWYVILMIHLRLHNLLQSQALLPVRNGGAMVGV